MVRAVAERAWGWGGIPIPTTTNFGGIPANYARERPGMGNGWEIYYGEGDLTPLQEEEEMCECVLCGVKGEEENFPFSRGSNRRVDAGGLLTPAPPLGK